MLLSCCCSFAAGRRFFPHPQLHPGLRRLHRSEIGRLWSCLKSLLGVVTAPKQTQECFVNPSPATVELWCRLVVFLLLTSVRCLCLGDAGPDGGGWSRAASQLQVGAIHHLGSCLLLLTPSLVSGRGGGGVGKWIRHPCSRSMNAPAEGEVP